MIKTKKVLILFLLIMIFFSAAAAAGPQDKIENLNFKNTDIVDVLRAIAEVADVNLITDSEISGNITVNLKDITFEKALDLITETRAISYKWDDNTVVVASPERLDSIYANIVTEFVEVDSSDFDNIGTMVRELFPETQITLDPTRRQFILKGEEENIEEIREMINRLDSARTLEEIESRERTQEFEEKEIEIYSESYSVLNSELEDLHSKLRTVNSNLTYKINPLTETITISGEKFLVKEAISMAQTYDQSLEPETRNIRVDYVDTEQITEIVGKFYPEIQLHVNAKRKEIIINGSKNKLDGVAGLIKEINRPQYQVVIETRVEEISSNLTREIGMNYSDSMGVGIGDILIERNTDLDKIESLTYKWPEIFRLLDTSSDSKTLARPSLMTLNGEEANLSITEEEPYAIQEEEDGEITTTWEYVEAGVKLTFTPWITENDEIELKIAPEVSSFYEINPDRYSNIDTTPPPATKTRSVETTLRLNNNETFVIGGLIQTDGDGTITKIPILGDIPILGELFKSRSKSTSTNELLIFVTPRIIKYGEEIDNRNIIKNESIDLKAQFKNSKEKTQENNIKTNNDQKIIQEYLQERNKTRKEILESLKDDNQEKEYQELTSEELEEILNN
ncbi:general secretion pathway protein D [Halanaerobium saccharolyticum]|uniref:General secretion pathway protein D n=1 Tax=Halanaerobium saccharolyticum TaxID=43595 RepID=A0A4R7YVU4_9FIRM|nr:type II and III secretion system protein [Halanaerobium saccharolyticum]RAK06719.1 general secretion pathway protein D [Halanaerobium saccharolyticum]TDW01356.1 general secretion pathway protein D [Halanaerobium saccharolyticum]TDX52824.1 general secretion pathway protein D [Halanaerobium saccharolyticum]